MAEEIEARDLEELARLAGLPHPATNLTYALRRGISGYGERAHDWKDKPHRLVIDACREIERLTAALASLRAATVEGVIAIVDAYPFSDQVHSNQAVVWNVCQALRHDIRCWSLAPPAAEAREGSDG